MALLQYASFVQAMKCRNRLPNLTDANKHEIVRLYLLEIKVTAIARQLGRWPSTINSVVREAGVPLRGKRPIRRPMMTSEQRAIAQAYREGKSIAEIAATFERAMTTVNHVARSLGLPQREKGGRPRLQAPQHPPVQEVFDVP